MGIAPDRFAVPTLASARLNTRALRALPLTALLLDVVLVSATVFVAAFGRNHLELFGSGAAVNESAALVGLPLVVAWIVVIAIRGGYDRGVFGAGADEYKVVVGSSLFAAAVSWAGVSAPSTSYPSQDSRSKTDATASTCSPLPTIRVRWPNEPSRRAWCSQRRSAQRPEASSGGPIRNAKR
jgi:hypothetical protein